MAAFLSTRTAGALTGASKWLAFAVFIGSQLMPHQAHARGTRLLADNTDDTPKLYHAPLGTLLGEHAPATQFPGRLLAQADGEDAYDPFADYSEFEESMDEEEDINFFRNGRLMTMGFIVGYRGFTDVLGSIYTGTPTFGLFISYFFDLRFALQFGFLTSDHTLSIPARNGASAVQGTISITDLAFTLKYYFNTQNVTRGLADLNPYVIGGFSQIYRTAVVSGNSQFAKDSAFAFDIGGGIEIPMMRNKMYFGGQVMYQLVNFPDEGRIIHDADDQSTGVAGRGDSYNVLGILGVNF